MRLPAGDKAILRRDFVPMCGGVRAAGRIEDVFPRFGFFIVGDVLLRPPLNFLTQRFLAIGHYCNRVIADELNKLFLIGAVIKGDNFFRRCDDVLQITRLVVVDVQPLYAFIACAYNVFVQRVRKFLI